jgi:hypothetical protein
MIDLGSWQNGYKDNPEKLKKISGLSFFSVTQPVTP